MLGVAGFPGGDDAGEGGFDFGGREFRGVQEAEGQVGIVAGEVSAEAGAELFDGFPEVWGEVFPSVDQEEVGFGEAAQGCPGGLEVGGAAGGGAVGGVRGHGAQGFEEVHEVGSDEVGEEAFEVAIMDVEGGGAHPEGFGQDWDGEAVVAEEGEEAGAGGADEVALFLLPLGEEPAGFWEVFDEGTEGSGWMFHGVDDTEHRGNGQGNSLRGGAAGRVGAGATATRQRGRAACLRWHAGARRLLASLSRSGPCLAFDDGSEYIL